MTAQDEGSGVPWGFDVEWLSPRHFQEDNGPMYCWSTEKDEDGWYWSWICYPKGPGSRSGSPDYWELSPSTLCKRRRRKDAKARAWRLFESQTKTVSEVVIV